MIGPDLARLYSKPFPASRTGALYNAFSYPTKIDPEAIALFMATHTAPGERVLDAFAGSGTTGLAALLCDRPTERMRAAADRLGLHPEWGPREAVLQDVGVLGAFVSRAMCNPPDPDTFSRAAASLLAKAEGLVGWMYEACDGDGDGGRIRHMLWSDVLVCPGCGALTSYWDAAVRTGPARFQDTFACPACRATQRVVDCARATEEVQDDLTGATLTRKRRVIARVHGTGPAGAWQRPPTDDDLARVARIEETPMPASAPVYKLAWGELHRAGYHQGITHLHHFYTRRNFLVFATLWELIEAVDAPLRDSLRLLALSYNASHATLMSRVVAKQSQPDLVLTGAQSGVLYVSGLPVEKNIFEGLKRKAVALKQAFALLHGSRSRVDVRQASSERIALPDSSVHYVFTDPPFGDYIPYGEINQVNEAWLGKTTTLGDEIAISRSQRKDVDRYGEMMGSVFGEIARVLRADGKATVVFHSAKASVWRALSEAYLGAGLRVAATSVLDKLQSSFKQSNSMVAVQGDPMLLLVKGASATTSATAQRVMHEVLETARQLDSVAELQPRRLYSRFVARCLELGIDVSIDAATFYSLLNEEVTA